MKEFFLYERVFLQLAVLEKDAIMAITCCIVVRCS